jgi:Ca2+-binding RTX toxin-like protein
MTGTGGDDIMTGTSAADVLDGLAGNDQISGLEEADHLIGGTGDDRLDGGEGADLLDGGDGDDVFLYAAATDAIAGETVLGGDGVDTLSIAEGATPDFRGLAVSSIERILLTGAPGAPATATFSIAALGAGLAPSLVVDGGGVAAAVRTVILEMGAATAIDLSGIGGNGVATLRIDGDGDAEAINGSRLSDELHGNGGNDTLSGAGWSDRLFGGEGTDILYFDSLDTVVDGGAGTDFAFVLGPEGVVLDVAAGFLESVTGNVGDDMLDAAAADYGVTLNGGGGADQLRGGSGNDTLAFDAADTIVQGSAGTDFAWAITELSAVAVNMAAQGIEIAWGGAGGDTLNAAGVSVAVQIDGKDGNDIITGGSANNILIGNGGADSITGGAVGDQLYFDHLDTVVNGGGGFDFAYVHNALGVTVNLASQQLEAVFGGFFDDVLDASGMATTAYLLGNTGADQLTGGAGDDVVYYDNTDTIVQGGAGYNFAYAYNVGFSAVSVNLVTQQFDTAWGGFGGDTLDATGKASQVVLVGLDGADTLAGGSANDTLSAGNGDDLMKGNAGSDTIFGEGGTGDVSIYDGVAGDYSWSLIGTSVYTVTHTTSGAMDTLYNVEFLRFTGGGPDVAI